MYIAEITALKGNHELTTSLYRDRPIVSIEIELVKLQLEELLGGPASAVLVSYSREAEHTLAPSMPDD